MTKFIYNEIKQELDNINRHLDECAADYTRDIPNLYSITGNITDYNTLLINRNDYLGLVISKIERVMGKTMRAEGTENNE
jgi:hypothetical protein